MQHTIPDKREAFRVSAIERNSLQSLFAGLPIRHQPAQKSVELIPVPAISKMTKLVHDDIVNAVRWGLHQVGVQQN